MGMIVDIYRSSNYDSALNVFHGKAEVTVINVEGPFDPNPDRPAAILTTHVGNAIIVPAEGGLDGRTVGPMMGGTYAATSDSRFGKAVRALTGDKSPYGGHYAVAVHDRYETPEMYDRLSR